MVIARPQTNPGNATTTKGTIHKLRNSLGAHTELSRQSCEIRDLLKCKFRLALKKVNDFKGLKSCKILIL